MLDEIYKQSRIAFIRLQLQILPNKVDDCKYGS